MKDRRRGFNSFIILAMLLLAGSAVLSGCSTFRRKFVRHSKDKTVKEDFIPVLKPVEYARIETTPLEAYKNHYAMVRAYFSDLYTAFASRYSEGKREQYLFSQVIAHLQGMAAVLKEPRQTAALRQAAFLTEAVKELEKPEGLRRNDLLQSAARKAEKDIRRTLKPDMVREFISAP